LAVDGDVTVVFRFLVLDEEDTEAAGESAPAGTAGSLETEAPFSPLALPGSGVDADVDVELILPFGVNTGTCS